MASTRVFEIAKQLGVKSKSVVEKCHAEGIPATVIKNHMSTVSVGLEQTIREWFASESGGEASGSTAVEQSDKVDLEKVRDEKPKRARKAASADESDSEGGTAVASPPKAAPMKAASVAAPPPPPLARPARPGLAAKPGAAPSAPDDDQPAKQAVAKKRGPAPVPAGLNSRPPESIAPEAPANDAPATGAAPEEPRGVIRAPKPTIKAPGAPPTMNVPTRPKVISPVGPKLADIQKDKIKLSGPKVVRVEAPERLEPPRPRGPRPGGGGGGGRGPGPMAPMGDLPPGGRAPARGGGGGGNNRRRTPDRKREGQGSGTGWSQADLAEREARLQRSGGYLKQKRQQLRGGGQQAPTLASTGGKVSITEPFSIKDLSAATGVKGADIVKKLFMQGVMATINSGIETEKAQEIMMDWEIELEVVESKTAEQAVAAQFDNRDRKDERARGPVVTILGHVDHGKTSLLDRIRKANVADGEAGGITQATSAFRVPVHMGDEDKQVVFIDTPGHEAFTAMRARGAQVTDIVVLVVAADDGVMPQTKESISHAKAAGVPIIVALNKIDKEQATDGNIQKILGQLAEQGLNPTEWGGDTEVVRTSAIKDIGIQELLEILDLQAQLLEIKADFGGQAQGSVIEARPEEGRGNVANILVQEGQLKLGDFIVLGRAFGRVRDITDDRGKKLKEALPPMPVQISGINELPDAGDKFYCVPSLKEAERAAEQRRDRERQEQLAQPTATLDRMFSQMAEAELKEILVVLKADVQGSVDVLKSEIEKVAIDNSEVKVRVIHAAVGGITESDILLANASGGLIVGFNVIANAKGRSLADAKGVEIRNYQVIYDIVDDLKKAAEGMLAPELRQEVLGHAEVRKVFRVSKVGMIAGCYVTDGVVQRDALIRVTRDGVVVENDRKLEQLKRVKDDAKEVRANTECGMKIHAYDDIKEGDVLECYKQIEVARTL